jgi:hypothetical protein
MDPVTLTKARAPQITAEVALTLARLLHRLEPPGSHRKRFLLWRTRQARLERSLFHLAEQANFSLASRTLLARGFQEIASQIASIQRMARNQTPRTASHAHESLAEKRAKSESATQALLHQVQTMRQQWDGYVTAIISGRDYLVEQASTVPDRAAPVLAGPSDSVPDGLFGTSRA